MRELIVDSFAGGGGASCGIEMALGVSPDIAINHDAVALAMHEVNHPKTKHLPHNIWKVDPVEACGGRPVGLLWASPDCKHFSKAKGAKPVEKRIRDLAWVVVRWARQVAPRVIILENVEEFATWGPLGEDGRPCPDRKGLTFRRWTGELKKLGYKVEHRELRACDYGAPTIRKRLFLIARRDGLPIIWPKPTHGDPKSEAVKAGKLLPWRAAAEIIDWSLPCPSIFLTPTEVKQLYEAQRIRVVRPLKPNTMARIAKGVFRYVINSADPFIVPITHAGDARVNGIREPLRTQTTAHRGEHALVDIEVRPSGQDWAYDHRGSFIAGCGGRAAQSPSKSVNEPSNTLTAKADQILVTPFVTKFNNGCTGHRADEPLHTITAAHSETHPGGFSPLGVVTPFLVPRYGERPATETAPAQEPHTRSVEDPLPVIVPTGNGAALIAPHLMTMRNAQKPHNGADEPTHTITAGGAGLAVVAAHISRQFGESVGSAATEPVGTITPGGQGKAALVSAFLAQHNYLEPGHDAREPVSTIVGNSTSTQAVVSAGLMNLKGTDRRGGSIEAPAPAITAQGGHLAEVRAFLVKYHGSGGQHASPADPMPTVDTRDRIGVVTVKGIEYVITDIGMRMLTARERFNAQGFPPSYIINLAVPRLDKKRQQIVMVGITGDQQGRMVGNSVSPVMAKVLAGANFEPLEVGAQGVPEFAMTAAE